MPASTVHVEPNVKGRWIVRHEDELESLSEHESATEAKRVACELAQLEGATLVLLHDRYARIHHVPTPGRSGPAAAASPANAPLSLTARATDGKTADSADAT